MKTSISIKQRAMLVLATASVLYGKTAFAAEAGSSQQGSNEPTGQFWPNWSDADGSSFMEWFDEDHCDWSGGSGCTDPSR